VHHVSDLHPKFTLRPHHVWKYGRHPLRLSEEEKERKKKPQGKNIMASLLHRAAINRQF